MNLGESYKWGARIYFHEWEGPIFWREKPVKTVKMEGQFYFGLFEATDVKLLH